MIRRTLALALLLSLAPPAPAWTQDDAVPTVADAQAKLQTGEFAAAAGLLARIVAAQPQDAQAWYLYGYALHAAGELEDALVAHAKAAGDPRFASRACYNAACASALLERRDDAFAWLGKAVAAGFSDRGLLQSDSDLDGLRDDPRFETLLPPWYTGSEAFVEEPRVLLEIVGEAAGDQFGWVARTLGDLDGDGVWDFASTAPTKRITGPACGRVYVYSGKTGKLLFHVDGTPGSQLGNSVSPAGDVNADGVPDVVAGAPGHPNIAGKALVYSGVDGAVLLELSAGEVGDQFGLKVCDLGDLDGDGKDDVMVGAPGTDSTGANAGRAYVYSGADGRELARIDGTKAGDQLGASADATLEGDHRILAIGAMTGGPNGAGEVQVHRWTGETYEPFFLIESDATGRNLGQYFVSILGDVDGDGVPDVYASDWQNAGGGAGAGRVYVHSGKDGTRILEVTGRRPGEGFGTSPSEAGDVDGDGHADLIVGAWQNADAAASAGKCYLVSGKDGATLATYTSRQGGDTLGFDATGIGDVDGDGGLDFLLTSAWSGAHGAQTGRLFIVAGPTFPDATEEPAEEPTEPDDDAR